jgi:hypothetical protein
MCCSSPPSSVMWLTDLSRLLENYLACPALPIPDVSSLLPMLDDYLKGMQQPTESPSLVPILTDLIAQATASAPAKSLSEHDANVVSDIFSSMQDFEEATRTEQGQARLCSFLHPATAEDIMDFWTDEWIA